MNKSILVTFVENSGAPVFACDERGVVICKNIQMKYICEKENVDEINHVNDLNIVMEEIMENGIRKFRTLNSGIKGHVYYMNDGQGEEYEMYVFDRTIAADRMVDKVMEHIDEVVVIFNSDGVIERMNSICDEILPFKRKEIIGKNINQLVEEGYVENPIITQLIEKKEKLHKDIVYSNNKIISYTAIPILSSKGDLRGGVLTGRDITRIMKLAKGGNEKTHVINDYISVSEEMAEIKRILVQAAASDASILLIGESGVGKEVLAKMIWKHSTRKDKPCVAINCAAIPNELIESELFGYEKGAFTGANKEGKMGLLESANGGTVFLDEIGELPLETQKKLLRVIQEGYITRIGGITQKEINVRFISATNKSTYELQDPKVFRPDLYYRLSVFPVTIPPLRRRRDDIAPLIEYYTDIFNDKYKRNIKLKDEAKDVLLSYEWPGNIRELKNVLERLVILSTREQVGKEVVLNVLKWGKAEQGDFFVSSLKKEPIQHYQESQIVIDEIMNIKEAHRIVEQEILKKAVEKYGNITEAAKAVGINPSTVYRKIKSGEIIL